MTVDLTPLLIAAIYALVPIVITFVANVAFKAIQPELVKYLGEKNAAVFQDRVNQVLQAGIGFAVQKGADAVSQHGGITFQSKNLLVDMAVNYAVKHAPDLMSQAGDVTEKVLARFDSHPAVQGLIAATAPVPAAA